MAPGMMIVTKNSNVSHWNLDSGYEEDPHEGEYPLRVIGSGRSAALELGIRFYFFFIVHRLISMTVHCSFFRFVAVPTRL